MNKQKMILAVMGMILAVAGFVTIPLGKTSLPTGKAVAGWSWGGTVAPPGGDANEIAGWSWGGTIAPPGDEGNEIAGIVLGPLGKTAPPKQVSGLPAHLIIQKDPQQIAGLPALLVTIAPGTG